MSNWSHWIHHCTIDESKEFATQIIGDGYIPWAPYAGRHIMDNFGTLIESLPQNTHRPKERVYE